MKRAYYSDSIADFLARPPNEILGALVRNGSAAGASVESTQTDAWLEQIQILQTVLTPYSESGALYFEFSIPRLGRRIDVLALIGPVLFVLEFKVGEDKFTAFAMDQVCDYALDLKNFHEASHALPIAPVVIPTRALSTTYTVAYTCHGDRLLHPIKATPRSLGEVIRRVLQFADGPSIDVRTWDEGRYHPTPTIVEAAMALYNGHSVSEISRSDASALNLNHTSRIIDDIIHSSRENRTKSLCFVTGVPGAGKTLVGLNIATKHIDK